MNKIKPLTLKETALKEELKESYLDHGQYIDKKAKDIFNMICHLEDFEIQYHKLESNWEQLKKWLEGEIKDDRSEDSQWLMGCYDQTKDVLNKIQELENKEDE